MPEDVSLGVLLHVAHRAMENNVFAALAEAGIDDITPAQAKMLARIQENGTRLTDLAEAAQVTKQTAGYLVDQLERAGYVERTTDPRDARARLVRLTEHALKLVPIARKAEAETETEWTAHLGRRRMDQLRDTLTRLREITDAYIDR